VPYSIVDKFEKEIAWYAGSKYGVAVESCCAALFLSLMYLRQDLKSPPIECVIIPKRTYPGVACSIFHADIPIFFEDKKWQGAYELKQRNQFYSRKYNPLKVYDAALRFKKGMYIKGSLYCLSFHAKKHLPIGRGGMILTDRKEAYEWLKRARFDGRSEKPLAEDKIEFAGWNAYMTPEQAARGLTLFNFIKDKKLSDIDSRTQNYPDLSTIGAYNYEPTRIETNFSQRR